MQRSIHPILPLVAFSEVRRHSRPLYNQLTECLLISMALADQPEMHRIPSERQIVKATGISLITVKRAMEELAAKGLLDRKHGSGNYPVRKPALQDLLDIVHAKRLAIYADNTFHASTLLRYDLLFYIQQRLAKSGADLLHLTDGDCLDSLKDRRLEGVFICGREFPEELQKSTWLPRVQVTATRTLKYVDAIRMDLEDAGRQASRFILKTGRKDVCMLGGEGVEKEISGRLFAETRRHLPGDFRIFEAYGNPNEIYIDARKWLSRTGQHPACVFSGFYLCTAAFFRAAEAESRSIGADVVLLAHGSNNIIFEDFIPMRILRVDRRLMADLALEQMLLRMIAPRLPSRTVNLPFV